ncbi:adenosylmethionine decarboxylase [Euryarchaeota archaeon]|nr:adenosylmethionine decarboxylase [Euryarchaeota archaeon]
MTNFQAHGAHVFLDYTEYVSPKANDGEWILEVLEKAVERSNARNVHSHVEQFDGSNSPVGFAAVVLLDESHVSAHCYSEKGWLALDCFTCGDSDPNALADDIHQQLIEQIPSLSLKRRQHLPRFLHEGE